MKPRTHALERTSPTGLGVKFVGYCIRCGRTDLPLSAALEPCETTNPLSVDDALLLAIQGEVKCEGCGTSYAHGMPGSRVTEDDCDLCPTCANTGGTDDQ